MLNWFFSRKISTNRMPARSTLTIVLTQYNIEPLFPTNIPLNRTWKGRDRNTECCYSRSTSLTHIVPISTLPYNFPNPFISLWLHCPLVSATLSLGLCQLSQTAPCPTPIRQPAGSHQCVNQIITIFCLTPTRGSCINTSILSWPSRAYRI